MIKFVQQTFVDWVHVVPCGFRLVHLTITTIVTAWWFATVFAFPYIGNKYSQLTFLFFRGVAQLVGTNQAVSSP